MTSRARPSRRSSGLTVMSIATVSPPSVATAQPSRGVWVTITSSAPIRHRLVKGVRRDRERPARQHGASRCPPPGAADHRGRHGRGPGPEPAPERTEVRLHRVVDQFSASPSTSSSRDVQLRGDLRPQFAGQLGEPRRPDQRPAQRLPGPDRSPRPSRTPQLHQPPHQRHLRRQHRIDHRSVESGPRGQVHRLRRAGPPQHAPHVVGHERRERRHQQRQRGHALIQRGERRSPLSTRRPVPEPPPRPAHVPVGQVVDEGREPPSGGRRVERLQRRGDVPDHRVQLAQHPPVQQRPLSHGQAQQQPASSRPRSRTGPGTRPCSSR